MLIEIYGVSFVFSVGFSLICCTDSQLAEILKKTFLLVLPGPAATESLQAPYLF
jgi:hypothetical protein